MTQPLPPEEPVDETLTPLEVAFAALVLAALASWLAAVSAAVLRPWRLFGLAPDPTALWGFVPQWTQAVKGLVAWLRDNAAPHGWEREDDEQPDVDLPVFPSSDSFVAAHLAAVANYLVRIPDEVYNLVFAEIADGHANGESLEQIAERVDRVLSVTASERWPRRARTIAVTEVVGASNAGWLAAAFQTEQILGTELEKEWIHSRDPQVRREHREAGGQRRRLREPFLVGGVPMMYPGDKSAPPELVIECRCSAATREPR